ncbi:MAG: response regulator, partial [Pseudomonadota bacterium]
FVWPSHIKFLDGETLEPLEASADPLRRALTGHDISHQTHLMSRAKPDEDQRYVRISSTKLDNAPDGLAVVFVLDDISVEERNRQVIERRSRLDALGQLTGGIAHDFNNLLAAQLYAIDLAGKATEDSKREKFLDVAKNSIQRGRALTSRLLAFARKQPGLATARHATVVFDEFEKLVSPMMEAHVEISYTVDEPELRVFCDQTQLETALMNLVLNSRDAILRSGRGSRIDLRARAVQSVDGSANSEARTGGGLNPTSAPDGHILRYVEFLVSDNGPGMDEETLARSTDPFFTTKDSNSGTGLGLAMVYGFVRQSDGDFRIYSEEGVGTTVRMMLPRGSEEGVREKAVPDEPPPRGNGETILVAEDELQLLKILTEVLEDLGYRVTSARSGQEAIDLIRQGQHVDLLLTDVVMPGQIGGFELARRLRAERPHLPVIYTSGYTGFTASEMGDVQAQLLQKPATPQELSEAISAALRGG